MVDARASVKRSLLSSAAVASAALSSSVSLVAWAEPAAPATSDEAIRLVFRAPSGCSSAPQFAAHVQRRSKRIQLVGSGEGNLRVLIVELQRRSDAAFRGVVTVAEPDGTTRTRRLQAKSCEEAVDALSLIAAVTLDPDAALALPEPEPEPAVREEPPRSRVSRASPHPSRAAAAATATNVAAPRHRFSAGLSAALLLEMAPSPVFGATAWIAVELETRAVFAPLLRLGVTHAERRGIVEAAGKANFAFTLPSLEVCPLRLGNARFGIRPCAFVSAGLLQVWGSAPARGQTRARFYGQAGGSLGAGLRLTQALEMVADGRAGLALRRDQYGFDGIAFFETPSAGFSVNVGAAYRFP